MKRAGNLFAVMHGGYLIVAVERLEIYVVVVYRKVGICAPLVIDKFIKLVIHRLFGEVRAEEAAYIAVLACPAAVI